jgi:hypothetical protein
MKMIGKQTATRELFKSLLRPQAVSVTASNKPANKHTNRRELITAHVVYDV